MASESPVFNVVKMHEDAVVPSKAHATDAGYDITVISKIKTVGDVDFFGTGISVKPPAGCYTHIYPRSSISKTGYMLANSVGIIDMDYQGELIVALRKIDKDAPDMELPCKIGQLVPFIMCRNFDMVEVESFEEATERGAGGFGSTGQ